MSNTMNRFAGVTRNIAIMSVGILVNKATGAVLFIVVARYLGEVGLGRYAFANSFATLFAALSDLGLSTLAVRAVAQDRALIAKYLGNIGILRTLLAVVALGLTGIAIIATGVPDDKAPLVWLLAVATCFIGIGNGVRWSFQALQKLQYESILTAGYSILMLAGGTLILFMGYGVFEFTAIHMILSILTCGLAFVLTVTRIARPVLALDMAFCRSLIRQAAPFIAILCFSTICFNIDTVILGFLAGDAETGRYNAAYRIIFMVRIIPGIFKFASFPVMVETAGALTDDFIRVVSRSLRYMIIIAIGIGVLVTFYAELLILIYGAAFSEAAPILRVLIWMSFFYFTTNVANNVLFSLHQEGVLVKIGLVSLLINLILNVILIPEWGGMGAAWAILASEGVACVLVLFHLSRNLGTLALRPLIVRPGVAAFITTLSVFALRDVNPFVSMGSAALVYTIMLVVVRAIPDNDLKLVWAYVKGGLRT